jgi:type II secretory pathway component PulF
MVKAGERASNLAPALRSLATEARVQQSRGVINFYRHYPVIALFFITFISMFIIWRVLPKFVDIYQQIGIDLPWITMALADAFHWVLLGGDITLGVLLLVLAVCAYIDHLIRLHLGRIASGIACTFVVVSLLGGRLAAAIDEEVWVGSNAISIGVALVGFLILLGALTPMILDAIRGRASIVSSWIARALPWWRRRRCHLERANFLAALGAMLDRQVPAPEALRLAAPARAPAGLARAAARSANAVESGEDLATTLVRRHLLKPREEAMLRLAARAGDLPDECIRLSRHLAEEAQINIARTDRVFRPLSVLLVALISAPILVGIYLPLFKIATLAMR